MGEKSKKYILDCTLRDGGYVNNWEFDTCTARKIMDSLYSSGIRCMETGIMGKGAQPGKSTKFASFDEIKPLLQNRKPDCRYAVMLTQTGADQFEIPVRSMDTPDIIRVAFFKKEWKDALHDARKLMEKGYEVFLQPMATFMYTEKELAELLRQVNLQKPKAVYMVDSFSNLYPKEIRKMADFMSGCLDETIAFGFHAHNNMQMAYANVIEFLETDTKRNLYIDGSICGMGRGAGNVPVELVMEYLNKSGSVYDIRPVLQAYQQYLQPVFQKYYWGYDHSYFLTACKQMNSVYGWYFKNQGITDILQMDEALDGIREEYKYTLVRDNADEVLGRVRRQ